MRKNYFGLATLIAILWAAPAAWAVDISFARSTKGLEILLGDKSFYDRLSQADINLRLKSEETDRTKDELRTLYAAAVQEWTLEDAGKLGPVIAEGRKLLKPYEHLLPDTIYLLGVPHSLDRHGLMAPEHLLSVWGEGQSSVRRKRSPELIPNELNRSLSRSRSSQILTRKPRLLQVTG